LSSIDNFEGIDQQDQGRHIQAYHFWSSLLNGRDLPSISDVDPLGLEKYKPYCFLVDFPYGYDNPVVRYSGPHVEADGTDYTLDPGAEMATVPGTSVLSQVKNLIQEVTKVGAPIGFDAQSDDVSGHLRYSRGMLLPFSDDGSNVHFVMGVVTWLDEPEEGGFEVELESEEFDKPEISVENNDLYNALAESREAASRVVHVDSRSRDALYDVLAQAYSLRLRAADNDETYENILISSGLREQERAPFTPVIKLIFGKNYDKTRITEYASALCYANRCDQKPEDVKNFIMSMPGGIKGCVQKERAERRQERGKSASGALEQAKIILENKNAIASVKNIPGDEGFVVMVGRRKKGAKKVEIVSVLDEASQDIGAILKRAVKNEK